MIQMKINYGIIIIHGEIMENNLKKYRIKEKKTLNQKVYQSIKNMIFDGEPQKWTYRIKKCDLIRSQLSIIFEGRI